MRLRVRHQIHYRFAEPARNVTHILRLTPRSHEGQHVMGWRIDVDVDCMLKAGEDGFGNITHTFTAKGPCDELTVSVVGEIENFDTAGLVRGAAERLPTELYLRSTPLTSPEPVLRRFAETAVAQETTDLGKLHVLLAAVHDAVAIEPERPDATAAVEAFALKCGNCRDSAHIFIACARHLGFPARFAGGYYFNENQTGVGHAWSEVFVAGLGWVGFDAMHEVCPQESHVRVSIGLDGLAAAPVRGTLMERASERLDITTPFGPATGQRQSAGGQNQSQSQG